MRASGRDSDPLRHVDPAGTDWTDWLVKYDHTADLHPLLTAQVNWGRWSGGVTIDFRSGDVYTVKAVQPLGSTHVSQLLAAKDGLKSWAKEMFSFSMTVSVPYTLDKLGNPHILLRDSDVRSIVEGNSVAMSGCRGGFCGGGSRTFANDGGTFDFTGTTSKTTSADVTVTSTHFRTNWLEDVANSFWEATHRNWQLNDSRDTTWHLLNDVYPTKGYLGTDNIQGVGPVPRFDPDAQVCEPSDVDPSQQMSVDPRIMSEP